ncbi:non-ribosomal peptide synthetase [Paralcaligenes ureilyticus]|uniref:Amino acid adenylation domain-containing protein n=1 Tax=Paralcaligenes ureilyticus TaxID=627131 RepID=A0A4R3LRY8_9BURK|nr:non-ribosomal peptide synthetase [Paralcaligenes ureilyticus]TCT02536.1 amino acid adenylation domain-containing protein [Paralcaligenes ureilyticus]
MNSGYIAAASFAQRQLRYLDLLQPGGSEYALPFVLEITGAFDETALRRAFDAVIDRHDVLRASFPLINDIPALAVLDQRVIAMPAIELSAGTRADWRRQLAGAVTDMVARPFNLEKGPVLAAALFRPAYPEAAGCSAGLAVVFHHAVADGASLPIFLDDLIVAYNAAVTGAAPAWQELALQYPDYADWEQERFGAADAPAMTEALRYWRETLRGVPSLLDLPLDRPRSAMQSPGVGATARLNLPAPIGNALADLARLKGCTPFMAFLAVFFTVLHRWSGLDDLVVTVPVSKRTRPELTRLIGLLVDTLPLRVSCSPDTSFDSLLGDVHKVFRDGIRHRDVPFQRIVQSIEIERRTDVVPLMQILFGGLEPADDPVIAADGTCFAATDDQADQTAKADISFVYRQSAEQVELWCRYDQALFEHASIENLLSCFGAIAAAAARAPNQAIGDLPLMDEAAGRDLIARFNRTRRPYPDNQSVAALFNDVARQHPQRIAIDDGGRLTRYAELADRSARLAAILAQAGLGPDDAVMLVLPLSDRFLALMLAILQIGAIYVPLDPAHPHAHRARLSKSIGARAVILSTAEDQEEYEGIQVLDAQTLDARAAQLAADFTVPHGSSGTAYIMFTSGSTGEPKGVAVPHRAIARLVCNTNFASFGPDTRAAVYSNPSFDASTLEIWAPLLNAGTAIVIERKAMLDIAKLRRLLAESNITLLWVTAGLFQEIAGIDPSAFAGNRLVLTGGDTVSPEAARAVLAAGAGSGLRLMNGYGPTENTTFSTTFDIAGLDANSLSVPIGLPIANSAIYVLDRRGQPLPIGVNGEIYVGGDGVANGYVGDPERTAAAFLPDPFDERGKARMYRTGDHGRWRQDGAILFAGRSDDQVKVRGFRIELNEIAAALGRHPALRTVHVAAPKDSKGGRQIVAYVVAHTQPAPSAADLRLFLEPLLPSHMLPNAYVATESLALNLNGKVDRKALPAVQDHHYDRSAQTVAPRTEEECALHAIWQELLGIDTVGVTDNFFHVGGDSILAIRMAARAADAGLPLTPTDVFQLQTIERLADAASLARPRQKRAAADRAFSAELVPIVQYNEANQPFLLASLALDRPIGVVELALVIQHLAERHEALRLRWIRDGEARRLEIMAYVAQLPFRTVEEPSLADAQLDNWIAEHAARIGRGLDTQSGVMVATTLIDRGPTAGPVVVLALHRAIADERTLALIVAELETAIKAGHAALPILDTAYGDWLDWLEGYADEQAAGRGLTTLESAAMRTSMPPLLVDAPADGPSIAAEYWLDPAVAATLTDHAPARLITTPLDILATALAAALPPPNSDAVLIEAIDEQRNLPRNAPNVEGLLGNLDSVLTILAPTGHMPVAARLHAVKAARQAVSATAPVYRVLGQTFDLPGAALGIAWSSPSAARAAIRFHSLPTFSASVKGMLVASAIGPRLRLAWAGAEPAGGAAELLERVAHTLGLIADLATPNARPLYTPADFPLAGLSTPELAGIVDAATDIEAIYPLSPMQEAMLVHTLAAVRSEINFEQSCMRIRGPLDHEAFRHAWATVFERHDVLRTAFHWRGLARPLQVVHRTVPLPLTTQTWPAFDAVRLDALLARDREQGFDLEQAPLVRLSIIQVAADDAYVVSSFHHLLVDGWCLGRLEREVRAAYETYRSRRPPLFDTPVPYQSYIAWLAQADCADSQRFFIDLLNNLPDRRRLFPAAKGPAHAFTTTHRTLDRPASRALMAFARRRGLTLATTLHFAWAVWLGARLGSEDVVFGTTVSGRPSGVPGVERIVGLFINNLPIRLQLGSDARPAERLQAIQSLLGQLQSHAHLSPMAVAEAAGGQSGPLFDTLVVVENLASGTSAWSGAEGLTVEAVHSRMKTAYDLTFIAIPGDSIALSLVQPDDGRTLEDASAVLDAVAAILTALPDAVDNRLDSLPRPEARPPVVLAGTPSAQPVRFATRPRSTLEAQIADVVADLSAVPQGGEPMAALDLDTDFWFMGVNSLKLIQLAARLEQRLDRAVPISLLLEHRSVSALARAIESGQTWTPVVPMTSAGTGAARGQASDPFVCVHPVAGDVSVFLDLARAMPASIPFWAIQAAGLEEGQEPLDSVQALAQANLEALTARGLPHPRWIGGYSFGGIIAFEMARQLAQRGTPPQHVVIIDTPAPLERTSVLEADPDRAHAQWLVRMADVRARFQGLEPVLTQDELLALPIAERFALAIERLHAARLLPPAATPQWLERAHRTSLVQYGAYLSYSPAPSPGQKLPLAIIRAAAPRQSDLGDLENRQLAIPDMGWQLFTEASIPVLHVTGDHVTMLGPDTAPNVAAAIASLLQVDGGA